MPARPIALSAAAAALALPVILAGCSSSDQSSNTAGSGSSVDVDASDTACNLSTATVPAGAVNFAVTNSGSKITEVYVYGLSGGAFTTVVSEVENIGPGISRDMSADLTAGTYEIACKPGQTGTGIRTTLTVTGGSTSASSTATSTASRATEVPLSITSKNEIAGLSNAVAPTGSRTEFKVTNKATGARVFEVKRPDGSVAGEIEIAAGKVGELYLDLTTAGTWKIIVEGGTPETETPYKVG